MDFETPSNNKPQELNNTPTDPKSTLQDLNQQDLALITNILVHKFEDIKQSRDHGRKLVKLLKNKKWKNRHSEIATLMFDAKELVPQIHQLLSWYSFCMRQKPLRPLKRLLLVVLKMIKETRAEEFQKLTDIAIDYWRDVEFDDLQAFLEIFPIQDKIKESALAKSQRDLELPPESLLDIKSLIETLVLNRKHNLAFQIILTDKQHHKFFIDTLIKQRNNQMAAQYATCLGFNLKEFPRLLEDLKKKAAFYIVKDAWYIVEDKLRDEKYILKFLVRTKYLGTPSKEAFGNSILWRLNPNSQKPEPYIENPLIANDQFCPTEEHLKTNPEVSYLKVHDFLPNTFSIWVESTSTPEWQNVEKDLLSAPIVSFDSEWKFVLTKYEEEIVSILQMATEKQVYIFDIYALKQDSKFQTLLKDIFGSQNIIKLAHSPMGDIEMLGKTIFGKKDEIQLKKCLDIALVYRFEYKSKLFGLANICEKLFGKPLSKFEQQSNWNTRPLRKSQIHYAALDAVILIQIYLQFQKTLESVDLTKYYNDQISDELMELLIEEEAKLLEEAVEKEPKNGEDDGQEGEGEADPEEKEVSQGEKGNKPIKEERKQDGKGEYKGRYHKKNNWHNNEKKYDNNSQGGMEGTNLNRQYSNNSKSRYGNDNSQHKNKDTYQVVYVPKETNMNK